MTILNYPSWQHLSHRPNSYPSIQDRCLKISSNCVPIKRNNTEILVFLLAGIFIVIGLLIILILKWFGIKEDYERFVFCNLQAWPGRKLPAGQPVIFNLKSKDGCSTVITS